MSGHFDASGDPRLGAAARGVALGSLYLLAVAACGGRATDVATHEVARGEFLVTHFEGGEVQAASGEVITSPRIGGRLKIIYLAPEGERVDVGDLVIQFDPGEFEDEMFDRQARLQQAQADFARARAERDQRMADIERKIEQQQAALRLAELNLERQRFASPIDQEQARIALEKARRALAQAVEDSIAQEVINRVDFQRHQLKIARQRERYEQARENYERTRVRADKPGIVVYRKIRKPGTPGQSKVAVGDNIWGGHALIDLPDLSRMQVRCQVGEMDVGRLQVGQRAFIRLEAFPGPVFHGQVASLAPMAMAAPAAPEIRLFEMLVDIEEQDERLKPGMSAEVEIVLQRLEDVLWVPLSAVVERGGQRLVYCLEGGRLEERAVELGMRNATAVVVRAGLREGDRVALHPPQ